MLTYTFVQNIKILAAPGSIANIGEVVGTAGYKKAMFIHGGSLRRSGVADAVKNRLPSTELTVLTMKRSSPIPLLRSWMRALTSPAKTVATALSPSAEAAQ